jgi:hypothetical protein
MAPFAVMQQFGRLWPFSTFDAAICLELGEQQTFGGHRSCVAIDPKQTLPRWQQFAVERELCLLTPVAADSKQRDSAEPSYEVKIEPGQRRADLMHCAALGKGPEVNSHEANAIDQIDHGFLSFAIVS